MNIGVAAHICAASPGVGARRYRADMTPDQRKSQANGILLCQDCAKTIGSNDAMFNEAFLHLWKQKHSKDMWRSVIGKLPFGPALPPTATEIIARFREAAAADFRVSSNTQMAGHERGTHADVKGEACGRGAQYTRTCGCHD